MDDDFRTAIGVFSIICLVLAVLTMTFSLFYMAVQGMCGAVFLAGVAWFLWRVTGWPMFPK